ncbi:MAG: zinc-ribbon domain-containing protein [Firmicutes bacterium]|nr:zinc-ribbon domain-containing protein [Bacillota bacterium]
MGGIKYCSECGAENAEDALFCEECGYVFEPDPEEETAQEQTQQAEESSSADEDASQAEAEDVSTEEAEDVEPAETEDVSPAEPEKVSPAAVEVLTPAQYMPALRPKKSYKIPILIIAIIAAVGAACFAYFGFFQKTELDLAKDLDAEILDIQGYNGSGYINEIDYNMAFERWDYQNAEADVQAFLDTVVLTTDHDGDSELSNGDTVKIIVKYKKADAEKHKIKVTGYEKTVKISGLQDYVNNESGGYDSEEEHYDEDTDEESDDSNGYDYVYDGDDESFEVTVDVDDLNIREGPGTDYDKTGKSTGKGTFTIVEVQEGKGSDLGWGRLESGGWVSLDYCEY